MRVYRRGAMDEHIFDSFQEFFALTRPMSKIQRDLLMKCLPSSERRRILREIASSGLDDLLIRNEIDSLLDSIKEEFNEDLVLLRIQVLSGQICKVRKIFWTYINDLFASYSIRHTWHILEGVTARDHTGDWVLLVPSKRGRNGEKKEFNE